MFNFFKKRQEETPVPKETAPVEAAAEEIKPVKPKKPRAPRKPKVEAPNQQISPKELATQRGEPWVQIINLELDPNNMGNGAIELDWNDIFVARLVKAGFRGKDDHQIVDQWFTTVCRNIVLETFEQEMADPDRRLTTKRKLDGGRSEFS